MPPNAAYGQSPGQAIRQIHDFYGWMAKAGRRGHCAGTLYRTSGFMQVDLGARNGTRLPGKRNIHIEHTVPVKCLQAMLMLEIRGIRSPAELHDVLVKHSVCTAFSHAEERAMNGLVLRDSSPAFDRNGNAIGNCPFLRYRPLVDKLDNFAIYNVVTGLPVDIETFTFEDHRRTLRCAEVLLREINDCPAATLYGAHTFQAQTWNHFAP